MSEAALALLAAAARLAWYAGGLGGAGLAFIALAGAWLAEADRVWLLSWRRRAALLGLAAGLAWMVVQVALLAGGGPLLDAELWVMAAASRGGMALALGLLGCLALLAAPGVLLPAIGGLAVSASHALAGHAAALGPGGAVLVLLHSIAAAAWIGSLPLLARLARRGAEPGACAFLRGWGTAALPGVALLLATGIGLALWLIAGAAGLREGAYGWALLAKVALVGVMLAKAARHRLRLVPRLAEGGGQALARSIRWQGAIALAVLAVVAALTTGLFGTPPVTRQ